MGTIVGQSIRERRRALDWTQQDLSDVMGLGSRGVVTICRWEKGYASPSVESIRKLCAALNVTADELLCIGTKVVDSTNDDDEGWGSIKRVPVKVATCPECCGKLYVQCNSFDAESGKPVRDGFSVDCTRDTSRNPHRWHQSEWQPVIDLLVEHYGVLEC